MHSSSQQLLQQSGQLHNDGKPVETATGLAHMRRRHCRYYTILTRKDHFRCCGRLILVIHSIVLIGDYILIQMCHHTWSSKLERIHVIAVLGRSLSDSIRNRLQKKARLPKVREILGHSFWNIFNLMSHVSIVQNDISLWVDDSV